ncbi:hypothetical protein KC363_g2209 [Hortaea werneckii]|nr:hypothetical protein KC363_g2209 [Hortaea werneckii]KAI7511698.1 hypothetical protein KC347_g3144 [Hortaea werneckii]
MADRPPLLGTVLCATSFPQQDRTAIATHAQELGAEFKLDLTCDVTHLIVGCITTPKYRYVAKERPDIKVLRREWLDAVKEEWKKGGEVDVQGLEDSLRLPPFFNLKVCITGFEDMEQRTALQRSIEANGGEYHPDLTKAVTHLIAKTASGAKYTHAKQWGVGVVSLKWYEDSLQRGLALDEALYDPVLAEEEQGRGAFRTAPKARPASAKRARDSESQTMEDTGKRKMRRTASTRLHSQSQDMWSGMTGSETFQQPSGVDQWGDGQETLSTKQSLHAERPSLQQVQVRRSDVFQLHQTEEQELQGLFAGRWITISGFPRDKANLLKQYLEPNGAAVVPAKDLDDASSDPHYISRYLLVPRNQDGSLHLPEVPAGTEMVTEWWVERCIHYKRFLEPVEDPLSRPLWNAKIPAFAGVTVCSTGFSGPDFRQTAEAVKLMGAVYEEQLTPHISVLLSGSSNVKKEKAYYAAKHNIPVVSANWLWKCLEKKQRVPCDQFQVQLPAFDPKESARSSSNSPALSANKGTVGEKTTVDAPPKRASEFRKKRPTPSLPLQAVKSEPSSTTIKKRAPFVHEDDDEDDATLPGGGSTAESIQARPTTEDSKVSDDARTGEPHPVLQEVSPNLSPSKASQSQQAVRTADNTKPSLAGKLQPTPGSPNNRQSSPHKETGPLTTRPAEDLTASIASLLQKQKAARSDLHSIEIPQRRKDRPLGRSASGIGTRSASASMQSEHAGSPSLHPDVSESLADGFGFSRETPPLPPGTQLGYETADAEQHRQLMEKRMKVKLHDEHHGQKLASVGMVKDAVDDSGVGNRVQRRHRTSSLQDLSDSIAASRSMDPFSITVGIVGLVDGGLSLSKDLKSKIDDFRNAEREVIELAHEIDLCTTLLDVLGDSLNGPENAYPKNIAKQTKRLVEDMRNVFKDVELLLAEFDYSAKTSARYMIKAETFRGHHDKLKGLQLSFIFMLSVCPAPRPVQSDVEATPGNAVGPSGTFEGTIQHVPIYTGARDPKSGAPVTYKATLTLQPAQPQQASTGADGRADQVNSGPDFSDRLEEAKKNKHLRKKLAALTSNPFFSREAFGSMFGRHPPKAKVYRYAESISIEPRMSAPLRTHSNAEHVDFGAGEAVGEEVPMHQPEFSPASRTADDGVEDILTYLFNDGEDESGGASPSASFDERHDEEGEPEEGILKPYPASDPEAEFSYYGALHDPSADDLNVSVDPKHARSYSPNAPRLSSSDARLHAQSPPSRYSTPLPFPPQQRSR